MILKLDHVPTVLVAENEEPHRFVLKRVFRRLGIEVRLQFVEDGQQLLDYLTRSGIYADTEKSPWPDLVLIDLHMPRLGGIEALEVMHASAALCIVPTIVFSSSNSPHHIDQAYASGANAYLVKAGDFNELATHLRAMMTFWLQVARLPRCLPVEDQTTQEDPHSSATDPNT
ncbi:MAG: response regulator [Janthinobacterium lividum]